MTCRKCKGDGRIMCPKCEGAGVLGNPVDHLISYVAPGVDDCPVCYGSRDIECNRCDGSGVDPE